MLLLRLDACELIPPLDSIVSCVAQRDNGPLFSRPGIICTRSSKREYLRKYKDTLRTAVTIEHINEAPAKKKAQP